MRILVIDDDMLACEMTSAILEELGHETVMAENAVEGAELLGDGSGFEVVLSDLNMPMVSGIDLFREMREQQIGIPFILLTGDNPADALMLEPKLDGCLMKDFTLPETLEEILSDIMKPQE
jgi:CheY-like chemotaxis protein